MIIFSAQTCVGLNRSVPREEMESLFAGMRPLEDELGPQAICRFRETDERLKGKVESHIGVPRCGNRERAATRR